MKRFKIKFQGPFVHITDNIKRRTETHEIYTFALRDMGYKTCVDKYPKKVMIHVLNQGG